MLHRAALSPRKDFAISFTSSQELASTLLLMEIRLWRREGMHPQQDAAYASQRIALVMPALNEEAAVGCHVRAILGHPAIRALPIERLIVVDNGSADATEAAARAAGAEVIPEPQRGYGAACLAGGRPPAGAGAILLMEAGASD